MPNKEQLECHTSYLPEATDTSTVMPGPSGVPDWVVCPGGNLGNSSAFGKALHEMCELGLIDRMPRLAIIQAEGANPLYQSYQRGFDELVPVHAETIATAIKIGNPVSYAKAVRALKWTNGVVEQVTDQESNP